MCTHPNPVRRCDLDSGILCAFVCPACERVGFRAFHTPAHAIAWREQRKSAGERHSLDRFEHERRHLSRPPLLPPSFTRAHLYAGLEPRA